jgi:hypothetical protein
MLVATEQSYGLEMGWGQLSVYMISSNKKEQSHSNEFEISSLCWPSKNRS